MEIESIKIEDLILDKSNPRFAELYSGSSDEDSLIEYLLFNESADEIAESIYENKSFYIDRPLWVIKQGRKYLVKDGNRRCAAVKALQIPSKYWLDDKLRMKQNELPVIIYDDEKELEKRIKQEHTSSLFRQWDRIAKALEVYRMHNSGSSEESLKELDSNPSDLIKLASFYHEAVKIAGEDFKKLIRRWRGKSGWKTIIFERLFRFKDSCGYKFQNKPEYKIVITDIVLFEKYITALTLYLQKYPETTHSIVDNEWVNFLSRLGIFDEWPTEWKTDDEPKTGTWLGGKKNNSKNSKWEKWSTGKNKWTVKNRPEFERKGVPPTIKRLIDECYTLDNNNFANSKMALLRVTFECILKYVIENTEINWKKLNESAHFREAYFEKSGTKRTFTNFKILRSKFIEIITVKWVEKAFEDFDLERLQQIIHNYMVWASPIDAQSKWENLMHLIEFMLQDESTLPNSLDTAKL